MSDGAIDTLTCGGDDGTILVIDCDPPLLPPQVPPDFVYLPQDEDYFADPMPTDAGDSFVDPGRASLPPPIGPADPNGIVIHRDPPPPGDHTDSTDIPMVVEL